MDDIRELAPAGPLRDPALVIGMSSPSNHAPSAAANTLFADINARTIAEVKPDAFYDFSVARPTVRQVNGRRVLEWPSLRLTHVVAPERDLIVMSGPEPHYHWQRFADAIEAFVRKHRVNDIIILNTFGAGVPHTRPITLRWISLSEDVDERFGVRSIVPRYQGPATASSALTVMLRDAGLSVGMLNTIVPFYVNVDPHPFAIRALAGAIAQEFRLQPRFHAIDDQIEQLHRHIAASAAANADLATLIANLEHQYDETSANERARPPVPEDSLDPTIVLADIDAILRTNREDMPTL